MCPRVLSGGNKSLEEIRAPGFDPDTMPNSTYRVRKFSAEAIENSYEVATTALCRATWKSKYQALMYLLKVRGRTDIRLKSL